MQCNFLLNAVGNVGLMLPELFKRCHDQKVVKGREAEI